MVILASRARQLKSKAYKPSLDKKNDLDIRKRSIIYIYTHIYAALMSNEVKCYSFHLLIGANSLARSSPQIGGHGLRSEERRVGKECSS